MGNSRFVWFDLITPDADAAKRFYSDVIGWKVHKAPGADGYEMWVAGKDEIGGLMASSSETRGAGSTPSWMGYISTDDIEGSTKKAQKLEGRIVTPPRDIPDVGKFAVLADPQGAIFALFQPKGGGEGPDPRAPGHFGWSELNTTDWKSAWKFYSGLFGWEKTGSMDMGPELGEYFMFGTDPQRSMGGMSNAAKMMKAPAHWLHYANVKSVDEVVEVIPKKGGKVLNGPMEVPGGDRIAQCVDPQGAYFAIFSSGQGG